MDLLRPLRLEDKDIRIGDRIVVNLPTKVTATCQDTDFQKVIFMFDYCVSVASIKKIYEKYKEDDPSYENPFDYYVKNLDKSCFGELSDAVEYRLPTIEQLFSHNKVVNMLGDDYRFTEYKFVRIDSPKERKRFFKTNYIPYWLSTTDPKDQTQYIVNSNGKLGTIINPDALVGICPIIVMKW